MGFGDDIKKFTEETKKKMESMQEQAGKNGEQVLTELLGDDVKLIESITLDTDVGKFKNVVAPEKVLAKLREANLLKE